MLSVQQWADFDRDGLARVSRVFSDTDAARMRERLWAALAQQYGIQRDVPATWTFDQPRHLQALSRAGVFDALGSPVLTATVDSILGAGEWVPPRRWGGPLVTFARPGVQWDVPQAQWHIDWPARGSARPLFGLKVLAFFGPVGPHGGGTVLLAGSHLLVERFVAESGAGGAGHSADVWKILKRRHAWLRALGSAAVGNDRVHRFMNEGTEIDGVTLRVVELTGDPGEAVFFHPWLFHAPTPNCTTTPRMMVGENIQTARGLALYAPVSPVPPPYQGGG